MQAKVLFYSSTAWSHKAQDASKSYSLFSTAGSDAISYFQPLGAIERRVRAKVTLYFPTARSHRAQDASKRYFLFSTAGSHRKQDAGKSDFLCFNHLET